MSAEAKPFPMPDREFVALMASIMALNALAIDSMLPAFPAIGASLHVADPNALQYMISSYMLANAVGSLVAGPLSDWLERRIPGAGRVWVTLFSLGASPLVGIWVYFAPDATSFYLRFILYSFVLTCWMPPLYALMYGLVLPRMRGIASSTYLIIATICGLGTGPYLVGMVSDATGGDLRIAILSVSGVAVPIVTLLLILVRRIGKDEALMLERARAAGEPV